MNARGIPPAGSDGGGGVPPSIPPLGRMGVPPCQDLIGVPPPPESWTDAPVKT